ncbi:hypothetical protein SAMN05216203_2153 [Marinobacter daqiaonensis]|uniref:Uncharacterized protein n=1 Tax=Marinobacter daqiaonensis TaxID=650891 RepID=A0A1I6IDT2_9GAMM|nr:hypothetical protein SAMN05216203_2153 [Marinobacter daqiaonensis]
MRLISETGVKASSYTSPVSLRLILTRFQLACQGLNADFDANDSLNQAVDEVLWRIVHRPGVAHSRLMLVGQVTDMLIQRGGILDDAGRFHTGLFRATAERH